MTFKQVLFIQSIRQTITTTGLVLVPLVLTPPALATAEASFDSTLENEPAVLVGDATDSMESRIDYEHMGLYQLKQNLYYHPSLYREQSGQAPPKEATVKVVHHHDHWGWGYGSPYWGWDSPYYDNSSRSSDSFTERVGKGVKSVAVLATVVSIVYGGYKMFTLAWPFVGAASLTAIELPANSPWRITGYKVAKGKAITYRHFEDNEDAQEAAREGEMFDRKKNSAGRFLLVDQEDWWGLTDTPVDIDVTYTRSHSDGADEKITVNFRRSVTNGLKSGTITASIINSAQKTVLRHSYSNSIKAFYPNNFLMFGWSRWYHQPSRIVMDFYPVATY